MQVNTPNYTILSLITTVILITLAALFIKLKSRRRNRKLVQEKPKWDITSMLNHSGHTKGPVKHGSGLASLFQEKPELLTYICFTDGCQKMIEEIKYWDFTNMKRLFLQQNKIQSIQPLASMLMPTLQVLVLSNNNITCFKSLRRMETTNLFWIEIHNNPSYLCLDTLAEMNLGDLTYMWLEFFPNQKNLSHDLSWLIKCQSTNLFKFHAKCQNRLLVTTFINTLKRKYPAIDLRISQH